VNRSQADTLASLPQSETCFRSISTADASGLTGFIRFEKSHKPGLNVLLQVIQHISNGLVTETIPLDVNGGKTTFLPKISAKKENLQKILKTCNLS